jgi:hypothetical protein
VMLDFLLHFRPAKGQEAKIEREVRLAAATRTPLANAHPSSQRP